MTENDRRWAEAYLPGISTFEEFVLALDGTGARQHIFKHVHFIPQYAYLCDENGKIIVDAIVRSEKFDEGMRPICERLGVEFAQRRDNADNTISQGPASLDVRQRCHALYRQDYDLLNYPVDPPDW
jgi:hypothetical protein